MENFLNHKSRQQLQEKNQEGDGICFLEVPQGKILKVQVIQGQTINILTLCSSLEQVTSVNRVKANIVCFSVASEERKLASTSTKAVSVLIGGVWKKHQCQPRSSQQDKRGCPWPDLKPVHHHVLPPDAVTLRHLETHVRARQTVRVLRAPTGLT